MEVRILGAHNLETRTTHLPSLLVDGVLALDAGSLSPCLSLEEQGRIEAVLITHRHYDHIRDLPTLGLATLDAGTTVTIHSIPDALEVIANRLMDGLIYPDFTKNPSEERPRYRLLPVKALSAFRVLQYTAQAFPVNHGPPSVGYRVASEGRSLFYSGDMSGGLAALWDALSSPDLLVVEMTYPSRLTEVARSRGHLTPALLREELLRVARPGRKLPPVVAIHLMPQMEGEIREELARLASELGVEITPGEEGMVIRL